MLNLSQTPGVTVPPAGSASATAIRRLQKDYAKLMQDPVDGMLALPNEDNILEWHYCLRGSPDTPFQGGFYWGKVIFKENFPWAPPAITMLTPNGRFATNVRLCLSISDYHPESWNPGWTVSAILIGLHSFMNENQPAAGSVPGTPQEQKTLASASKEFNVKYKEFRRFFPQLVHEWTGVYPTPDEPNVAPTMLPEHATPKGVDVPTIGGHSSRAAFGGRPFEQMMNALRPPAQPGQPNRFMDPARFREFYAMPQPRQVQNLADAYRQRVREAEEAGLLPPMPQQMPIPPPPVVAPGAPMYRDLAALAAQQQQAAEAARQQNMLAAQNAALQLQIAVQQQQIAEAHQQAMRNAGQMMGSAVVAGPVPMAPPPVPQQRVLRPRGVAGQDEQNGRRAEMLQRLGMEGQGQEEFDNNGVPLGRGARRATRRDQQNPINNAEVVPPKRARRV